MAYDQHAYIKSLEKTVDFSLDTFKYYMERLFTFHMGLVRTYLWVSAFIITIQFALLREYGSSWWQAAIVGLAIVPAIIAFLLAVDQLRGKKAFASHIDDPLALSKKAQECATFDKQQYESFLGSIIKGFSLDLPALKEASTSRVKRLRCIASLLMTSALASIAAAFTLVI